MNPDKKLTEYVDKLKDIKLSDSSRLRMEESLLEYARFHNVRVDESARSILQVPQSTSLFTLFKTKTMNVAILVLMLLIGGGTSFAAQVALPGDFLYPVKTEVNENVRSAFAIGADSEAELQTELIANRVAEAEELKAKGKLTAEVSAELMANIKKHTDITDKLLTEINPDTKVMTASRVAVLVESFSGLIGVGSYSTNDSPALASTEVDANTESDAIPTTMLATRKMDPESYKKMIIMRVENMTRVLSESKSKISAEVNVTLAKKMDEANKLKVDSKTQAELESQQSLMKAEELTNEVDAKLSTLGTAEFDESTGLITRIDFSKVPPTELIIDAKGQVQSGGGQSGSGSVKAGATTDTSIDSGMVDVKLKTDTAADVSMGI